eukprot:47928-Rhodomonas_salina.2
MDCVNAPLRASVSRGAPCAGVSLSKLCKTALYSAASCCGVVPCCASHRCASVRPRTPAVRMRAAVTCACACVRPPAAALRTTFAMPASTCVFPAFLCASKRFMMLCTRAASVASCVSSSASSSRSHCFASSLSDLPAAAMSCTTTES